MSRSLPPSDANLVWVDETDSTNAVVARLVEGWLAGSHEKLGDTVVVAACQRQGRGRGDHQWQSPPGGSYATWFGWVECSHLSWVPLAAGVSLGETIESVYRGVSVGLEWPNDLRLGAKKLGGILCQARTAEELAWAAVGFGVNVEEAPALAPGDATSAGSLREAGYLGGAAEFTWRLAVGFAVRFRALLAHPGRARDAWMSRSVHRPGDELTVRSGGALVEGRFAGLERDGRLKLEVGGGCISIASGEIVAPL